MTTLARPTTCRFPAWLRPRITLRLLLALVTLFCIWLAIHVQRARRQQAAVRFHELHSSTVYYDYMQVTEQHWKTVGYYVGLNLRMDTRRTSSVPGWLLGPLGRDFFHDVVEVHVGDCDQLRDLADLPGLTTLTTTGNGINDDDIEHVARLRHVRRLVIPGGVRNIYSLEPTSGLTDRSLELVARMPRLESLEIAGTFSAAGIAALAESRSLREITIKGCDQSVTGQAAELLRRRGRVQSLRLLGPPSLSSPVECFRPQWGVVLG